MPSIADVYVTVLPETSRVSAGIVRALREADPAVVEAGRRWRKDLERELGEVKVDVKADTAKAKAEIDAAAKDHHSTIHVDVDKDRVGRGVTEGVERAFSGIGSSAGPQGASIGSQLGTSISGAMMPIVITALAGVASSLSGVLGLLPAGLAGAGTALGTLVVGLDGVKTAWDDSTKAAQTAGKEQASHAREVSSAQLGLKNAVQDEATAQKDVANARKDALRQLQDLNLELRGGALDEKQAILDAQAARRDLATGRFKDSIEYEQAVLRVQQADQRVAQSHQRNIELQQDASQKQSKGVEGSDQVVAANQRLERSHDAVAQAQSNLNVISAQTSSAAQSAAQSMSMLSPNAQSFVNTLLAMKPAFTEFKNSIQDALFTNMGPMFQQLASTYLPMLQTSLTQMASLMNQAFGQIADLLQQPAMVQAVQTMFNNINQAFQAFTPTLTTLTQAFIQMTSVGTSFLPQLGEMLNQVAQSFAQFVSSGQFAQWVNIGMQSMQAFIPVAGELVKIFADLAPIGLAVLPMIGSALAAIQPAIAPLASMFAALIQALTPLVSGVLTALASVVQALAPAFTQLFNALTPVITQLMSALMPAFTQLSSVLTPVLTQIVTALTPVFQQLGSVIGQVALALAQPFMQAITTIAPFIGPLAQAFANLVNAVLPLVPTLINIITDLQTPVFALVGQTIGNLVPIVIQLVNVFADLARKVLPPLLGLVEKLVKLFGDNFSVISKVIQAVWTVAGPILRTMAATIGQIVDGLSKITSSPLAFSPLGNLVAPQGGSQPAGSPALPPIPGLPPPPGVPTAGGVPGFSWPSSSGSPLFHRQQAVTGWTAPPITAATPGIPAGLPDPHGAHTQVAYLAQIAQGLGLTLTAGKNDHVDDGLNHPKGLAGDFAIPGLNVNDPKKLQFAQYLSQNFGDLLQELIYSDPNFQGTIFAGKPHQYDAKTLADHVNHVHASVTDANASAFIQRLTQLGGGVGSPMAAMMPAAAPLSTSSSKPQIAQAIYSALIGAGYSPETATAAVASGLLESGLNPNNTANPTHNSIFQTDKKYGIADDPAAQIQWWLKEAAAAGGPSAANADPMNFIANKVERGGYPGSRYNQFLGQAQSLISQGGGLAGLGPQLGTQQMPMYVDYGPNSQFGKQSGGEQLGQDFLSGILQVFGIDGSVFKDPTSMGGFKMFKGLMSTLTGQGGNKQGMPASYYAGGDGASLPVPGGGDPLSALQGFIPQPFGDLLKGQGAQAPGQPLLPNFTPLSHRGAVNHDNRIIIEGNVGSMDDLHGYQTPRVRHQTQLGNLPG